MAPFGTTTLEGKSGNQGKSGEISCFDTTTRLGEIGKSREISRKSGTREIGKSVKGNREISKVARGKSGNQ